MKKILLILLLVVLPSFGALNLMVWDGSASTDMNDTANWTGTVAAGNTLGTGDSCLMNAGSTAATASANVSIGALVTTSGYSGAVSFSGRTLTIAGIIASFDNVSALNGGNLIEFTGAVNTLHVGTGITTMTAMKHIKTTGNSTIDLDELTMHIDSMTIADNTKVTNTGSSGLYCRKIIFGSTDTLSLTTGLIQYPSGSGRTIKYTPIPVITGAGVVQVVITATGTLDTVPKLKVLGTGQDLTITYTTGLAGGTGSFYIEDTIQATDQIAFSNTTSGTGTNTLNGSIICANLLIGTTAATARLTINSGSTIFNIGSMTGTTYNGVPDATYGFTWNMDSSTINCSGAWTAGSNHAYNPGTSTTNITNTSTVTTANKHFWNLVCNGATKVITFVNRLVCENNFTITAGKPTLAASSLDTVATDWVNNLTGTDTCDFNNDSVNLGGSYTGNLRVKNHLRTNLYGTALCNFTSNGSIPNRIVVNGTDRTKQMKLIDRYHSKYLTVTTGNLNTTGMDCFADSAIVINDSVATVLGDTISSRRVTFGASAKPDLVNPMLLYFGLALTDTLFDTCARNIGNVFINKSAGTIWQTVGVTHLTNLTVNGGKAILGSSTTDTVYCVDFFANNYGAGDSIILNAPLVISGNLAANVKWGGASKIILAGNTVISAGGGRFPPIQTLVPRVITTSDSINFQKWTFADSTEIQLSSSVGVKVDTIGDISGSAGKLIYFFASTPGTAARVYGPNATVTYTKWTDITYRTGVITASDGSSVDGGGTSGIVWLSTGRHRHGGSLNCGLLISTD